MGTARRTLATGQVAAERREFDGILKRVGRRSTAGLAGREFAWEAEWKGDRWLLVANGPGPALVERGAGATRRDVDGIVSTGFCGALDPALRVGDIVVSGESMRLQRLCARDVHPSIASRSQPPKSATCASRPAPRSSRWNRPRSTAKAREWGVPFCCIRAVSDTAPERYAAGFQSLSRRGRTFFANADCAGSAGASVHSDARLCCAWIATAAWPPNA